MGQRFDMYGQWQSRIGENISYGNNDALGFCIALIVDDGVPSRGHRENFFDPDWKVMGCYTGPHLKFKLMVTIDYAVGFVEKSSNQS